MLASRNWTLADVTYDAGTHRSWLSDGTPVPHVTEVLGAVRVATDFEALVASTPRIGPQLEAARALGTAVHADCHAYDDDDLDWQAVDPRVRPYVEAWATFRENKGMLPLRRERRLFHPVYIYTGIEDGVFLHRGRRVLVDIKTGDPADAAAHLQTAAYEAADAATHPGEPPIDERWAVWLRPECRVPYRVANYTDRADAHLDFGKFQACLCVYNEQPERRRRQ